MDQKTEGMVVADAWLSTLAPMPYQERPEGRPISFTKVCGMAGIASKVTTPRPTEIRIHVGVDDFIAAIPGRRVHCFAEAKMPKGPRNAGRYILRRLAYAAHDWAARETLRMEKTRPPSESDEERRKVARETLPMRRLLRERPGLSQDEIAQALGVTTSEVARLIDATLRLQGYDPGKIQIVL